jgi:nucleoside-diphosphate-sugar epimerase
MSRLLVTGATGYIGAQLVNALIRQSHEVHVLCRLSTDLEILKNCLDKITIHKTDSSFNLLMEIISKCQPDVVIHVASLFISEHLGNEVHDLIRSNIEFPSVLLDAMHKSNVKCLINTGTSWQHYERYNKNYSPTNLYSATKQAFEDIIQYYVDAHDFSVVTLTIFDTYGSNDTRKKLLPLLATALNCQTPLKMSMGEQKIDLVHVDDVVVAYLEVLNLVTNQTRLHQKFDIKSGHPQSLRQIAKIFEEVSGKELSIEWGGRSYREREIFEPWEAGQILPNWTAKIDLKEGIRRLLQYQQ